VGPLLKRLVRLVRAAQYLGEFEGHPRRETTVGVMAGKRWIAAKARGATASPSVQTIVAHDVVVLATNDDALRAHLEAKKLIVDLRGVYREPYPNVVKA